MEPDDDIEYDAENTSAPEGGVTIRSISSDSDVNGTVTVTMEQAVQQCKDYMNTGKWLNLIFPDGSTRVESNGIEYFRDEEAVREELSRTQEVQIMIALAGGQ